MNKSAEAFRTIGEVADELDVPKHVLRFWEGKFPQIRPMKRGGGRRYYRPEDMELLRGIRHLLHAEGYTIKGVQKILREQGIEQVKLLARGGLEAAAKRGKKATAAPAVASKAAVVVPKKSTVPLRDGAAGMGKAPQGRDDVIKAVIAELEHCRALLAGTPERAMEEPATRRSSGRS